MAKPLAKTNQKKTDHLCVVTTTRVLKLCGLIVAGKHKWLARHLSATCFFCFGAGVICHHYICSDVKPIRITCHVYAFINVLSIFERWNERINDLFRTNTNKVRSSKRSSSTAIKQCAQFGGVLSNTHTQQQHSYFNVNRTKRITKQKKNEMTTWKFKSNFKGCKFTFLLPFIVKLPSANCLCVFFGFRRFRP